MFIYKRITGEIIECVISREYTIPRRYYSRCLHNEYDCEYEYEYDNLNDYFVEYDVIAVKVYMFGSERIVKFSNITLAYSYKVSDTIVLIYNRFNKTFNIKG